MKAIAYLRRSKKSEDNTVSLLEQERQIREYCDKIGAEVAQVLCHDGVSGANRDRWLELAACVQEHAAGAVVAYHQDRLARDTAGLLDNLRLFSDRGVEVHEVGVGLIDIIKPISKAMTTMRAVFDELYRDVIREKTKDALNYRKSKGQKYTRIAPFGYLWEDGLAKPHPEEQRAIKLLQEAAGQGLSVRAAMRYVRVNGYRGRMSVMTAHRCMKNIIKERQDVNNEKESSCEKEKHEIEAGV